jgi:hypothetical protein
MRRRLTPTEEAHMTDGTFPVKLAGGFLLAMDPDVTYWLRFESTPDGGFMVMVAERR